MSDDSIRMTIGRLRPASTALAAGQIVRLTGVDIATQAQANSSANLRGTIGVMLSAVECVIAGAATVLLDTGLTPEIGDPVYVSATNAGQGTTIAPGSNALAIGVVTDASRYAAAGVVELSVTPGVGVLVASDAVADWSLNAVRVYALDYDAGSDQNTGFADSVDLTAAAINAACVAAGAVALKTWQGLQAILPAVGAGRQVIVLIKPRANSATYLRQDGVTAADLEWWGYTGYRRVTIGGTTDFTNTTADQLRAGGLTATAGPNADGSWTVAAGATTTTFNVDGAQTLPAEATILGRRIRWATGALAGTYSAIHQATAGAGGQIVVWRTLSGAPSAGDTFFIEQPGVAFNKVTISGDGGSFNNSAQFGAGSFTPSVQIKGIAATANSNGSFTVVGPARNCVINFCEDRGGTSSRTFLAGINAILQTTEFGFDNTSGASIAVGVGMRCSGIVVIEDIGFANIQAFYLPSSGLAFGLTRALGYIIGGSFFSRVFITNSGPVGFSPSAGATGQNMAIGANNAFTRKTRIVGVASGNGAVELLQSSTNVDGIEFANCTVPLIIAFGAKGALKINATTGGAAEGNTNIGLDLTNAWGYNVALGTTAANTFGGTLGEVRLPGGAIATHATFTTTNVVDNQQNNVVGTAGSITQQAVLVSNQSGGALAVGDSVRGNGTTGEVASAQADTAGNATFVGIMVTPPASGALGYMVTDGVAVANFDGVPTLNACAYVSVGTAKTLTTTVPPAAATNQKLRVGRTLATVSGNFARVRLSSENQPVTADGSP